LSPFASVYICSIGLALELIHETHGLDFTGWELSTGGTLIYVNTE
jgi:hypothetical protein